MINKLFARFSAKVAIVALTAGFATGGLAAAGAFSAHQSSETPPTATTAVSAGTQISAGFGATTTATATDGDDHETTETVRDVDTKPTATVMPEPEPTTATVTDDPDDQGVTQTAEGDDDAADDAAVNHGHCVSFAASIMKMLGLSGEQNGDFISLVARDKTAVSAKVATGGTPDAACLAAIVKAKSAALASGVTATAKDDHGDDEGHSSDDHGKGKGEHGGSDSDNANATTTSAVTGSGSDHHEDGGDH